MLFALGAFAAASLLVFPSLNNHSLWSDEADTALFARNLLEYGELRAWDGKNLIAFAGGLDLDLDLVNAYMPRQQYLVAALGLTLFGDSVSAVRAPFALIGLLTIALAAWWARRFLGKRFAWPLPAWILALSPAYLLYIANCRYYALGAFWTVALLALWTEIASRPARGNPSPGSDASPRRRALVLAALAPIPVLGLFTSQYLYGAAALASLPFFFLEKRFRTRTQCAALGVIYGVGLACVLYIMLRGNPANTLFDRRPDGVFGIIGHWLKLAWWHIRDAGAFEFFAWPMLIPLALPWLLPKKLKRFQPLARRALVLAAACGGFLAVATFLSPQDFKGVQWADMRYLFPLIVPGAVIAAAGLVVLSKLNRWLGIAIALVLIGTNALHIGGAYPDQKRHLYYDPPGIIRSTLADYIREQFRPIATTSDRLYDILGQLPDGSRVWMSPSPLATSSMFRLPNLHYCGLLDRKKELSPKLAVSMPSYIYNDSADPDIIVVILTKLVEHEDKSIEFVMVDGVGIDSFSKWLGSGAYRPVAKLRSRGWDESRPDIPIRLFYPPEDPKKASFILWILARK